MRQKYECGLKNFCSDYQTKADDEYRWLPRTCCKKHSDYDKRTPGLFKIEFEGDEMISLCSKTYLIKKGEVCKFSSKGVNKQYVKNPLNIFRSVLQDKQSRGSVNAGFRLQNNSICTYSQEKLAFPYLYCKRQICADGVHTIPLDITLHPVEKSYP